VTQFKSRTDFSHGNEVAYSCDQRLFFSSLTRLRREPSLSIRKKYPLEPRVGRHKQQPDICLCSLASAQDEDRIKDQANLHTGLDQAADMENNAIV